MAIGTVDTHKKSKVTVITFVMIQSFMGELNADGCRIEAVAHTVFLRPCMVWIHIRTTGH